MRFALYLMQRAVRELRCLITTYFSRTYLSLYGVSLQQGAKFFGVPYIYVHPNSEIKIGKNVVFRSSEYSNTIGLKQKCYLSTGSEGRIIIGNDCGFSGTVISAVTSIVIGDRVLCGANVTICDSDRHSIDSELRFRGDTGKAAQINISNDVWIGMNSVLMKGVSIGDGSVVAANSVVTRNVPSGVIVAGSPARVVKRLSE